MQLGAPVPISAATRMSLYSAPPARLRLRRTWRLEGETFSAARRTQPERWFPVPRTRWPRRRRTQASATPGDDEQSPAMRYYKASICGLAVLFQWEIYVLGMMQVSKDMYRWGN